MAIGEEVPSGTSTGTTTTTIDHHHPLFLQPRDTPGISLISIQLIGSENYALRSRSMEIGLIEFKRYSEHFEYQRLLQFLMGLNETYAQPRSQILMMSPVPSFNKAYSMVISEEIQRILGKFAQALDTGDSTILFTNKGGITKDTTTHDKINNKKWIVDSSATNHMVHTRELLDKINTDSLKSASKVHLPDDTSLDIACTGESKIDECGVIRNVLYIPDFKYNLLSVSKFTRDLQCFLSFYPVFWIMKDLHNGKVKGIVRILRSDNGTEFFNSECNNLFQLYGMIHQSSYVHTPQQNGVVERKHRHILEVAREIRLQARAIGDVLMGCEVCEQGCEVHGEHISSAFEGRKVAGFSNGVIEPNTSNDIPTPCPSSEDENPPSEVTSPPSVDVFPHKTTPAAETPSSLSLQVLEDTQQPQ
ncbi:uncharacterized protein [Nicotiana sylvestris]|uniref:uncharacterized protein n=1 Tax=Nicotiana sylvestris TaxID=4096 RepID=UPI00388C8377